MHILRRHRLQLLGLLLLIVLLALVGLISALEGPVAEFSLNSTGEAYEVFRDKNGSLWISDYGANEIWQVDLQNTQYTVIAPISGATDAKVDDNGDLWWTDYDNNTLGYLATGEITAKIWPLNGTVSQTLGLAIDQAGNIWTSDEGVPAVHQFNPSTRMMCAYDLPDGGASSYIVADSGRIWLGDWINNRILALNPQSQALLEYWQLPVTGAANIYGLAADEAHDIWWADQNQNFLGQLTPSSNLVTTYTVPLAAFGPTFVSTNESWVWSTGWGYGFIGRLSPAMANGTQSIIVPSSMPISQTCVGPVTSTDLQVTRSGPTDFTWSGNLFKRDFNFDGWLLYEFYPIEGGYGMPWGIVAEGPDVFIVDQGRQKLTWLRACFELTLNHTGNGETPLASPEPLGICPEGEHLPGDEVTLTGRPAPGYGVTHWKGTDDDGLMGLTNTVTMPAEKHAVSVEYGPNTLLPFVIRD